MTLWENLAKMPAEDRKKYLDSSEKPKNTGKTERKVFGGVSYETTRLQSPEGGWAWDPAWGDG